MYFFPFFCNKDMLYTIYSFKMDILILDTVMEGNVSQIFNLGPSFIFI